MKQTAIILSIGVCFGVLISLVWSGRDRSESPLVPPSKFIADKGFPGNETTVREVSWTWKDVESDDFLEFDAHLQHVGCPEITRHDILFARISRYYARQRLVNPMQKYWETDREKDSRMKRLAALDKERKELLQSLGFKVDEETHTTNAPSPFPPEKMREIAKINQEYPQRGLLSDATPEEYKVQFDNRRARLDYLSQILTPDELTRYRLSQDSNVGIVSQMLRVINATPEEVNRCAFVFDFSPSTVVDGTFAPDAQQGLAAGLGPERFAELQSAFTPDNIQFTQFILSTDVTPEEINQLKQLNQQGLSDSDMHSSVGQILGADLANKYFKMTGKR